MIRRSFALRAVVAAGFFGEFGYALLLLPLLQHYLPVTRGLNAAWPGYVLAAYGFSRLAGQVPLGSLAERIDHRVAAAGGYLAVLAAGLAFWLPLPPIVLLMAAAVFGLGHALADPIAPAALAQAMEPGAWGKAMALLSLAQAGGLVAGLGIGAFVADLAPASTGFLLVAIANTLALVLLSFGAPAPLGLREPARTSMRAPLERLRASARMMYLLAAIFFLALAVNVLTPDLSPFAVSRLHSSLHVLALYLIPASLAGLGGLWLGGLLADRLGRLPPLLAGAGAASLAVATLTHVREPWPAAAAAVVFAIGLAFTIPASGAALLDEAPADRRALTLSSMMATQGMAQAVGPFLGGVALALAGAAAPLAVAAVALWLSVPLCVLYASSTTGSGAAEIVAYTPLTRWLSGLNARASAAYLSRSLRTAVTDEGR